MVEIADYVLWPKHIHGNEQLKQSLLTLKGEQLVELEVDGVRGLWTRMAQGKNPRPTEGLKALGKARDHWHTLFRDRKGDLVEISLVGSR
jgi:hypothetical protein